MEPLSAFRLPYWWPRIVWRTHPGEQFGFLPIHRAWGVCFGTFHFIGFVQTRLPVEPQGAPHDR